MLEMNLDLIEKSIIIVKGEVDIYSVGKFREAIERLINSKVSEINLDCTDLTYMDSTGMGVLIELRKKTMESGQKLVIMNPRKNIKKLLDITGVTQIIDIIENPENQA